MRMLIYGFTAGPYHVSVTPYGHNLLHGSRLADFAMDLTIEPLR
jgi:hypothetical protein